MLKKSVGRFAEASSGDDFIGTDAETFEEEDEEVNVVQKTGINILIIFFSTIFLSYWILFFVP